VIAFSVIPNSGAARTATLSIAGQVFTLTQTAGSSGAPTLGGGQSP
jgi:hypothetical protein